MIDLPRILIFSPASRGGIAEHTYYQARALTQAGAQVICLIPKSYLSGRAIDFETIVCLPDPVEGASGLVKKLRMVWQIICSRYVLAWQVIRLRPDLVLLDTYSEYLSPLWIDPHILLSRIFGVCYAANLHDPVRNFVIGPKWWHRHSVWLAYQPLDFVLVHHELTDRSIVPKRVKVVEAPHGLYEIPSGNHDPVQIRSDWGVVKGQSVFLSFGHIRDGKNIDLAIQALVDVPDAVIVVAGAIASSHERPVEFYRELAVQFGVADRCRIFDGFVSEDDLGKYFSAADFILLTYSAAFHSQSGVLNLAAKSRKAVLASASPSPMIESVKNFGLGIVIEPGSSKEIASGMQRLIRGEYKPEWEEYESTASWEKNAEQVLKAAGLPTKDQP